MHSHISRGPSLYLHLNEYMERERTHKPHLRNHVLGRDPGLTLVQNNISFRKKLSLPSVDILISIWINNKQQLPWQQLLVKA